MSAITQGKFWFSKKLAANRETVIEKIRQTLPSFGFGILTEIDVQKTMKAKLQLEDYPPLLILGVCNPKLAKEVLDMDQKISTLLPCNLVVSQCGDLVEVSVFDPTVMVAVTENEKLEENAATVKNMLKSFIETLD